MTTSIATKSAFTVRPNNFLPVAVAVPDGWAERKKATAFTLKGGFEHFKDTKAVMLAKSRCDVTPSVEEGVFMFEISWIIGLEGAVREDLEVQAQGAVDQFVTELIDVYNNSETLFKGEGVDPQVFIESLKPRDEFDGKRNGALASSLR